MRIAICGVQVPFVRGGSELLVESLARELRGRGIETDVVQLPFKWYPSREVLSHALAWRLLDLTESSGRPLDLVIATKFPSYLVRHSNKVLWLFHQFRQAYDLEKSPYGEENDGGVREAVRRMDGAAFGECRNIFTISGNVGQRLRVYNRVESTPLYPPPPLDGRYRCDEYSDFILSAGRLESIKRVDLLIKSVAASKARPRCVIAGNGPDAEPLRRLAKELGLANRVSFEGWVSEERLLELYATCRAVYYAPYDEDYGFVTLEAFRSQKPVVTAADSGGVLEWVTDGATGFVIEPDPKALGVAIDRVMEDPALCERLGEAGFERAKGVTWDRVIEALVPS